MYQRMQRNRFHFHVAVEHDADERKRQELPDCGIIFRWFRDYLYLEDLDIYMIAEDEVLKYGLAI